MQYHFSSSGIIMRFSVFILFCSLNVSAQQLNFAIGIGGLDRERVEAIATDKYGNVFAAGTLLGNTDFDGGKDTLLLEAAGKTAVFISKYTKTGEVIWASALQCVDGYSVANCIEVDDSGNVYIAGTIRETMDFDPSDEEYLLSGGFNSDIFIAKYDSLCRLTWAFVISGSFNYDDVFSLNLDRDNNIYITGFTQASMDFDPGPEVAMLNDGYIAKYTSDGQYLLGGNISESLIVDLVVDSQSNIYLAGTFHGSTDLDMGNGSFRVSSNGERDWFLARYTKELQFDWGFSIGTDQNDDLYKISLMGDQEIITTGTFTDSITFDPADGSEYVQTRGQYDIFVAAYDTLGGLQWNKTIGGSSYDDVEDMVIDKENNIILTGSYQAAIDMDPGEEDIYLPVMGLGSTYLGKYGSNGDYLDAYSPRSPSGLSILALSSDPEDNLFIAGTYSGSIDLDLGSEVYLLSQSGTVYDSFLAGYFLNEGEPSDTGKVLFNEDLVMDINPDTGSFPSHLFCFRDELYFLADDGSHGKELWKTGGSEENTRMIMDINPDGAAFNDDPRFVIFKDKLFFTATDTIFGTELWVYETNARMVKDIHLPGNGCGPFTNYSVTENFLYFTARDTSGIELWKTDGEEENTVPVKDINPNGDGVLSELAYFQNSLFFFADDGIGSPQLWSSNGSEAGTVPFLKFPDKHYDFSKAHFFVTDSILYFGIKDSVSGGELWISDGSSEGTQKLVQFSPGAESDGPANFSQIEDFVFFTAFDDQHGTELWKTRGSAETTELVSDINPNGNGIPGDAEFISANNELYFTGEDDLFGIELWKTDGYDSTTRVVANINPGSDAFPNSLMNYNDEIYFAADNGEKWNIWRSREHGVDIHELRGLHSHGSSSPEWITYCKGIIYFTASDGTTGNELWKYILVTDIEIEAEDSLSITISELDSLHYIGNICVDCPTQKSTTANQIKLSSSCYPADATDTTLSWSILKGENLASIDPAGTLTLSRQLFPGDTVTVLLQTEDGSKKFREIYIISDTASHTQVLSKQAQQNILLFPNPVSDKLYIKTQDQNSTIEVYDISGRKHNVGYSRSDTYFILDIHALTDGVYLIRIVDDESCRSERIIKTSSPR